MHFDARGNNPDLTDAGDVFTVESPFRAASIDGLGIGMSLGCFAQRFGQPTQLNAFSSEGPQDIPQDIYFRTEAFRAFLFDGSIGDSGPADGIIDKMLIFPLD
ncbi:MAG: hypothetical protein ACJAZO_004157 [Myxococcota bacterium]|jgi:hypothetical protein